jgi:hypothetical protein
MSTGAPSFQPVETLNSEYLAQVFLIKSLIARMATVTLVQVVKVTNTGSVAAVGFVDLQPLVSQVDPNMNPTPHAIIRNNPYFRIQGGKNAIIIDPEVGDVGIALFASRDISAVNSTLTGGRAATKQDPISPGSFRKYDMADALYLGGVLNGVPTQFIQFTSTGIVITSPHDVTVNAVNATINASAACNVTSTGKTTVTASEVDLVGGGGTAGGAVQKDCICAWNGQPHVMVSATVKATP